MAASSTSSDRCMEDRSEIRIGVAVRDPDISADMGISFIGDQDKILAHRQSAEKERPLLVGYRIFRLCGIRTQWPYRNGGICRGCLLALLSTITPFTEPQSVRMKDVA